MHLLINDLNGYSKDDYDLFLSYLSNDFRKKACKYKNEKLKNTFILRKYIKIKGFKDYKDCLFFSDDCCNNFIVSVFSSKKIGIGICKINKINSNIVDSICTDNEKKYIANDEDFFKIFALKKAYLKMKNWNLNKLKFIEFYISNDNIICSDNKIKSHLNYNIDGFIIGICEETR